MLNEIYDQLYDLQRDRINDPQTFCPLNFATRQATAPTNLRNRMIEKYFSNRDITILFTSNFFSILHYYSRNIAHLHFVNWLKQILFPPRSDAIIHWYWQRMLKELYWSTWSIIKIVFSNMYKIVSLNELVSIKFPANNKPIM